MIPLAGLAIGAKMLGGLGQLAGGLFSRNKRPSYKIPQEYMKNAGEAEAMAREGMAESQYTRGLQNIGRNQASALKGASLLGGGSAFKALTNIARAGNDATLNLDIQDAQARRSNQLLAMNQRQALAQQKLAKQQWDKFGKYQEKAQMKQGLIGGGLQNIFGGLTTAAQIDGFGGDVLGQGGASTTLSKTGSYNNKRSPFGFGNNSFLGNLEGGNLGGILG